jgi:uncharacterized protein
MREHDALRRDTLRMALSAAHNQEVALRRPLTDDEVLSVIAREVRARRESIEAFEKGRREDLASKERAELEVLSAYLPQPLDEEALRGMVLAAIAESGARSARDLGKVMGILAPRTRNRADGRQVSAMVAQELARADLAVHSDAHSDAHSGAHGTGE